MKPKRVKQPVETRRKVMAAGAGEFRRHGYQGASLNRIVNNSGVTKGAFFHHFRSKRDIALAMLDEIEGGRIRRTWINPVGSRAEGVESILSMIEACRLGVEKRPSELDHGSMLWNIAAEMSPLDEGFRSVSEKIHGEWIAAWESALRRDHAEGRLAADLDWHALAAWLVEAVECALAAARIHRSPQRLGFSFAQIAERLLALQTQPPGPPTHRDPPAASGERNPPQDFTPTSDGGGVTKTAPESKPEPGNPPPVGEPGRTPDPTKPPARPGRKKEPDSSQLELL